jgi:hypothetical protein
MGEGKLRADDVRQTAPPPTIRAKAIAEKLARYVAGEQSVAAEVARQAALSQAVQATVAKQREIAARLDRLEPGTALAPRSKAVIESAVVCHWGSPSPGPGGSTLYIDFVA